MAALAARAPLWLVVAAAFLGGIGLELFGVGWSTAMGRHIPADRLSRVSSYDMLGSFVFIPIGYALGGPISSAIGISATVWGATAVTVVATLAVLLVRQVRTMPAGAWPEGDPESMRTRT
jgi:MFS family permease